MTNETSMKFGELVETARGSGFELYDARQLPVDPELQMALEDGNLMAEPVRISLRRAPQGVDRGIVADLSVRDQVFHLWGEWSRTWELEQIIGGASARPGSSPLGEPPERREG